ncbi:Phosphate transport system permease protein [Pseudodesulfovibrio profundus]|uniref:Phosphate transport system permease protein n=1 Tax=Pseudodesulfovibrio profundus TaxID=57320 RepID=A0A2C8FCD2_9BACT|nr:phosphate ABC transporter permease subunit PstC [Pseudodesulfovibrio profundus]MBC17971.1 phosphate ABC transporter permease subunit PstC [Desulfovibrio sp.]SOB60186.1 Phosphate transport system permease protein [Pseudodesulfovibrio profundus]|tara:strand:- start:69783 stop:71018 length:1236 start_codon:yes stop_codon:yes gene_type:complete
MGINVTTGTIFFYLICGLLPLSVVAYFLATKKTYSVKYEGEKFHSTPGSYGWYAIVWTLSPALLASFVAVVLQLTGVVEVPGTALIAATIAVAAGGLWVGVMTVKPSLKARQVVEDLVVKMLFAASLVSIFTTIGIVISVTFEAIKFFEIVSLWDFITGTTWNPDEAVAAADTHGVFGSIPLFAGTFMITAIAMVVAVPIGLFAAICMAEYATPSFRKVAKPALEILAGIPTVVYGFFAAITVSPMIVNAAEFFGLQADFTNALSPGIVMGIMIIPLISSLSDDVITSVPNSLREGSLAMGAFRSESIKTVILPAALPGIVSAFLLAVSRAVGETMIVVMAAGLRPNLTWNPLEGMTTVTVRIVDAFTGDQAFDSPETLSAFGLGLVLLVVTLVLNVISLVVIRRFRQQYE